MDPIHRKTDPLQTPVQFVKGVGPFIAGLLGKLGIETVADLFYHFPHRYVDRRHVSSIRELAPGVERSIIADVVGGAVRRLGNSRRKIYEIVVSDGTGLALLVFFNFNEKYLKSKYPAGKKVLIFGECRFYGAQKQFTHPDIEEWEEEEGALPSLVPVYPSTEGLYQKTIRKIIVHALTMGLPSLIESDFSVRAEGTAKISLKEAIRSIHGPPASADLVLLNEQKSHWHQRVIYDELFYLQLGLGLKKRGYKKERAYPFSHAVPRFQKIESLLPFTLTNAQRKTIGEIKGDLEKNEPMNRLLQGDVGSGKTLVAFMASLVACDHGTQTAFMAPTEILAQQHFINLKPLADSLDLRMALLTRSTPKQERGEILKDLASNNIQLVLGTHALIQEDVDFHTLGLVIIDEQHRFGVRQRAALKNKCRGEPVCSPVFAGGHTGPPLQEMNARVFSPHILVMTATPIPRTMAMSVYGDLDVSVLDELPAGRKPIVTKLFYEKQRSQAYGLIRTELKKGRQVYFVYPLIEESEKIDLKNALDMAEELKKVFSEFSLSVLHGRMTGAEKEEVMKKFKQNTHQILVSTTVIEVGVDVANATVMVVEHAERFGLSQLHQLRGRVGRAGHQSFCFLLAGYAQSEDTRYRLSVMEKINDGFVIAEEDLKIRGPGDFLGTRQSGLPLLRLTHLVRDAHLLNAARKRALEIMEIDPDLALPEHRILRDILKQRWEGKLELAGIS